MRISPTDYTRRAAELEQLAASASDLAVKEQYLNVARELRVLVAEMARFEELPSDEEVEHLAERMIGSSPGKP